MPYFDENPLKKLAFQAGDADALLDLRGMDTEMAVQKVEKLLSGPIPGKSFLIQFDPAAGDGRETLFQPLGRRLLQARRDGVLSRCLPAADATAYFICFVD